MNLRSPDVPFEQLQIFNLEPTNDCNLHCSACLRDESRPAGDVSLDLAEELFSQLPPQLEEIRLFNSGEPLLNPDLPVLIEMAAKRAARVLIHTNGTKLDETRVDKLLGSPLTHLSISFDGGTKKMYEEMRGGASWETTLENIRRWLVRNKGKVHTTIQIIRPWPKALKISQGLEYILKGANRIYIRHPHNWNEKGSVKGARSLEYGWPCSFLWLNLVVNWDGRVPICCACLNNVGLIADAKEVTLKEIWEGKMLIFRKFQLEKRSFHPCSSCERYSY